MMYDYHRALQWSWEVKQECPTQPINDAHKSTWIETQTQKDSRKMINKTNEVMLNTAVYKPLNLK